MTEAHVLVIRLAMIYADPARQDPDELAEELIDPSAPVSLLGAEWEREGE